MNKGKMSEGGRKGGREGGRKETGKILTWGSPPAGFGDTLSSGQSLLSSQGPPVT